MIFVSRPAGTSFTSAQVTGFYFRPCLDDHDEVILEYFRCRCGTVRKQTYRNGLANLMQHVRREHPNVETEMLEATTGETGSLLNNVRRTSQMLYGWLLWIAMNNLPLSFCENRATRRFTTLDPICVETLRATMEGVVLALERSIASEMPDSFGLILDGWTHMSEHYLAVFACYEVDGKVKGPLLCMAPLLNEEDDGLSTAAHREFLADMLPRDFGTQLDQCVFFPVTNVASPDGLLPKWAYP
ncbi:GTP-dependent nucleic acid-binding protein engD [Phytophthora cinnamomi]|uniref:GTP-dependent nucleic acid-binding protein engD n=1 Tax=Phytophthora cinnamomi TaxID=4785 RepID=UPI003559CBF9|nr:GTP-dependent nucleic acid-binding protein engD [Phytophthora cinnamomi]